MSINILDLKQKRIKKTYNIGGQVFHLYNLNFDEKNKIADELISKVNTQNGTVNITDIEFGKIILSKLTDIDFSNVSNEQIEAIFENPCEELQEVFDEGENILIESREKIVKRLQRVYRTVQLTKDEADINNKINSLKEELGLNNEQISKLADNLVSLKEKKENKIQTNPRPKKKNNNKYKKGNK